MEISRVTIPLDENGIEITIDIKDAYARQELASISQHIGGSMSYLGETTTPISTGSGINPIEIDGEDVTVTSGTCVSYRGGIFLYNGRTWREFGSVGALRALAYKDEVEAEYTPEGTITKQHFTGKEASITANVVPRGRVDLSMQETDEDDANYIPQGDVSAPNVTVVPETRQIMTVSSFGRLPTCEFPQLYMEVEGEGLSFRWAEGSFDQGSAAGGSEEVTVMTGVSEVVVSKPQFTGTPQKFSADFFGQGTQVDMDYTPEGEISTARFEGTPTTIRSS